MPLNLSLPSSELQGTLSWDLRPHLGTSKVTHIGNILVPLMDFLSFQFQVYLPQSFEEFLMCSLRDFLASSSFSPNLMTKKSSAITSTSYNPSTIPLTVLSHTSAALLIPNSILLHPCPSSQMVCWRSWVYLTCGPTQFDGNHSWHPEWRRYVPGVIVSLLLRQVWTDSVLVGWLY